MKFSGRTQMLSDKYSMAETLRIFKKLEFGGVEVCFEDLFFHLRPDLLEDYMIQMIRKECSRQGLTISAVSDHRQYLFDEIAFEQMKREICCVKKYGTNVFIISAMHTMEERLYVPQLWETAVSRIGELCRIAEKENVLIALEPEPGSVISSTQDFLRIHKEIASPALKINLDIGHAFLTDVDILDSINSLEGLISHCHVEDMYRGQHIHLLPGAGDMDIPTILSQLMKIGFNGWMSLDLYHYRYENVAKEALETLRFMIGKMEDEKI